MDEYLFREYLDGCTKVAEEATTCFEAFIFGDESGVVRNESVVEASELEEFLGDGERMEGCVGGMRLL